jgi:hypothetical protein
MFNDNFNEKVNVNDFLRKFHLHLLTLTSASPKLSENEPWFFDEKYYKIEIYTQQTYFLT